MTDIHDHLVAERSKGGTADEVIARLRNVLTLDQRLHCGDLYLYDQLTRMEQAERAERQRAAFRKGSPLHEAPAAGSKAQTRHAVQERPISKRARRIQSIGVDKVEEWNAFTSARGHYLRKPLQDALVEELDKAVANLRASAQGQLRSADELEIIANACRAAGVKTVGELPIEFAVQVMERIEARPAA